MCGGGGDGGAGEARQQEEDRQARIKAAVDKINGIFDSRPVRSGTGAATAFDPNASYYDAEGNAWKPPSRTELATVWDDDGGDTVRSRQEAFETPDMDAINRMIADKQVFTGVQEVAPAKTRDQLYAEQKQAVYDINARDISKQFQEAERQNRFGLARSGLLGSSVDVDSNAQLQEKTNEGLMKAAGIADQAAAELKTADERSRQSLISMAQSGIDTGTAQGMALRNLDATAQAAQGQRQGASIGGLFNDLSQAYLMRQAAAGSRAGAAPWQQQTYGVSTPQQTYSGAIQK